MARPSESGSKLPHIIGGVVILALAVGLGWKFLQPSDDPILSQMAKDPETAMQTYLKVADDFYFGRGSTWQVEKVVTKDDYDWFQNNAGQIFKEREKGFFTDAADPTQMGAIALNSIMKELLGHGPHKASAQIVSSSVAGDTATFTTRQAEATEDGEPFYVENRVTLVKEGKYWKMKDFGGGRAAFEDRQRPEDRQVVYDEMPSADTPPAPGGEEATGSPAVGPAAIAQADTLIEQAGVAWAEQRFQDSLNAAQEALGIYEANLGPDDPKIQQVRQMVQAAEAQLGQMGGEAAPGRF